MIRTEIYLELRQRNILKIQGKLKGKSMAKLIREAIDLYLGETNESDNRSNLEQAQEISKK